MEAKKISQRSMEIQVRFFQALDLLISSKEIKGLKTFCTDNNLHRAKYSNLRNHLNDPDNPGTGYKFIDIDALSYLTEKYHVSADWLLTGKGGMFEKKK